MFRELHYNASRALSPMSIHAQVCRGGWKWRTLRVVDQHLLGVAVQQPPLRGPSDCNPFLGQTCEEHNQQYMEYVSHMQLSLVMDPLASQVTQENALGTAGTSVTGPTNWSAQTTMPEARRGAPRMSPVETSPLMIHLGPPSHQATGK